MHSARFWCTLSVILFLGGCVTGRGIQNRQQELQSNQRNIYGISGAAFSPDSRLLAIGTGKMTYVFEVSSGKTLTRLPFSWNTRFGRTRSLAFVDDVHLVTAGTGAIRVWNAESGFLVHKLRLRSNGQFPRAIAWSDATGTLALTISDYSSTLQLVRLDEFGFGVFRDVEGVEVYPRDLQFSRDGRFLAAAGDGKNVQIFDLQNGQSVGQLPTRGSVSDLELFGNRQLLVAGEDVALWTFKGEQQGLEIENPNFDGQIAAQVATKVAGTVAFGLLGLLGGLVGSPSSGDSILGAVEAAKLPVIETRQSWCGRSTTISPDGRFLADVYPGISKELIRIYELNDLNRSRSLDPRGEFTCVAMFSPDGKLLLVTTNKVARLYEVEAWNYRDLDIH